MTTTHSQNLFNDLAALLTGQLFLPEDAAYEPVRQLWNGKVKTRPAAIVRLSVEDVIHTVRWTRAHTAFSSRCRTRDFRTIAAREWRGD